jgi:putative DNA primase/helicase
VSIDISAANITPASIFRTIEAWRPTLLLDEGDTYLKQNDEMRGVLNSGFSRASAYVIRTVGDNHEPRQFATWCPKVIALIEALPDTLQDRSLVILLRRKLASEKPERFSKRHHRELDDLCAKCARWVVDNIEQLDDADPDLPDELNDRAQDCWRPLFAIADAVAGEWPDEARRVALALAGDGASDQSESAGVLLLGHIRDVFETKGVTALKSSELADALNANEEWPWCEWRGGREISYRGVAALLKPYGIRPQKKRNANEYVSSNFEDAWDRYLDPVIAPDTPALSSTTSTDNAKVNENRILGANGGASTSSTSGEDVEDQKSPQTPVDTSFVEHVEHEAGVRPNGHAPVDDTDIVEVWI